jgi:hypothetical protein
MIYALMGYAQAAIEWRLRAIRNLLGGERGQGTVEYVGLILLVSLLMVGMVAAMKGFNRSLIKTRYYRGRRLPSKRSQGRVRPSYIRLINDLFTRTDPAICKDAARCSGVWRIGREKSAVVGPATFRLDCCRGLGTASAGSRQRDGQCNGERVGAESLGKMIIRSSKYAANRTAVTEWWGADGNFIG